MHRKSSLWMMLCFIGEWSRQNALNLIIILRFFNLLSGLKVSLEKGKVFGIRFASCNWLGWLVLWGVGPGTFRSFFWACLLDQTCPILLVRYLFSRNSDSNFRARIARTYCLGVDPLCIKRCWEPSSLLIFYF